jgi:hypothetical protein
MIRKLLMVERVEYKSNLTAQNFKYKLEKIFNQGTFDLKYNLAGKFIGDTEFKVTDKWTIGIIIKNFEKDPAYLKGKMNETPQGLILEVSVRPNSVFPLFRIISPILGVFALFSTEFDSQTSDVKMIGLVFIVFGLAFYLLGKFLRYRLRNKFEQYLDLKKAEE